MKNPFKKKANSNNIIPKAKTGFFNKKNNPPQQSMPNPEFTPSQFQQNHQQATFPQTGMPNIAPANNKKNQILMIALVIIIAILVIAVAAFFFLDNGNDETSPVVTTTTSNIDITTEQVTTEAQKNIEQSIQTIQNQQSTEQNISETNTDKIEVSDDTHKTEVLDNSKPTQPLDETEAQIAAAFSGQPINTDKQQFDESSLNDLTTPIFTEDGKN